VVFFGNQSQKPHWDAANIKQNIAPLLPGGRGRGQNIYYKNLLKEENKKVEKTLPKSLSVFCFWTFIFVHFSKSKILFGKFFRLFLKKVFVSIML